MACPLYCILLLHIAVIIISQSPFVSSQNNTGKFSVGQSLLAKSNATAIVSPSGDFAFGFHQFPNSSSNLFLLSIWYAKIPDTIVWYANGGNPVAQGSKLTITAGDGLILNDPKGNHLWNTSADFSILAAVSYGFMNDTANFVLKTSSSNDIAVWETFKFPTDSLLPSQVLQQGTEVDYRVLKSTHATNDPNNQFISQRKVGCKCNPTTKGMLGASAAVNFILVTAIILTIFCYHKRKQSTGNGDHQTGYSLEHNNVQRFPYRILESATNGFSEEVGRGSFGVVYKGTITVGDDSTTVAVKKLDRTFMGADKEFTAEVNAIGLTHHKNLVRFIGYCKEDNDKRLLVYEYMPNGTVVDYLFTNTRPSWPARINIAQGVARGLLYLHEKCTTQIIHCDIKPQNILVDDQYNARISDFGLAKLLVLNQSQTNTAVRGTKGYVAPEWFKNKPISVKVDVYSFGVLLLEIVCCRRCVCLELSAVERTILTDWTFDCYQSGMLDALVNDDVEALNDRPRLERFVKIGLWCIQEDPNLRPTMQRVNQMLEGVAEVPNPPCQTSFSDTYSSDSIP